MSTKEFYTENKQYGNRYNTDFQLINMEKTRKLKGIMDKQARFIEENQLLNEEDWCLFVKQYESNVDDFDGGWRGEYFGKMMRGACMTYQYTKSEGLYNLLYDIIVKMLATQDENGRFSTYSVSYQFNDWDMWCRKYVILGFLHFHEICKDEALKEKIVEALVKHLDYIIAFVGEGDKKTIGETSVHWGAINSASILEPVIKMYNITGKEEYIEFARHIIDYLVTSDINIITLALENEKMPYQYSERKAYEMMSCFEGLLEYYRITGEEKYKESVIKFVDAVKETDISVIGCAGCEHELFNHSVATQTDTDYKGIMQETCVTVTWMKLCNQLLMLTGDPKYADYIEHAFYNALYGAVNNEKNSLNGGFMFDSYSPLTLQQRGRGIGGHKNISEDKYYGCCAAIGAAGTALPLLTSVNETKTGIAINYYEEGSVCISGYTLKLETEYPAEARVKITVEEALEEEKEFLIRVPAFSGEKTKISVNGEICSFANSSDEGFYASVTRAWKKGDIIEIEFFMNPRVIRPCGVEGKPKTKDFLAVLYGPLALARDAKISEVGTAVNVSDTVKIVRKDNNGFDCVLRADVKLGEQKLDMIDYGSAGKTWDEASLTEVWLKCK